MAQKILSCPLCGSTVSTPPFKTWQYAAYKVGRYQCKHCGAKFNLYLGSKSMYTIPKAAKKP